MNQLTRLTLLAGVSTLLLGVPQLLAQQDGGGGGGRGPGNFDPAQRRQRMIEMYKERLEVTSDDEWKVIQSRLEKVQTLQREAGSGGMGRGMFGGPRRQQGGDAGGDQQQQRRQQRFGPEPSAEETALQDALEKKASTDEIKAKLSALREARKAKEAELEKAREELRKVLSVKQEAQCVLMGVLK